MVQPRRELEAERGTMLAPRPPVEKRTGRATIDTADTSAYPESRMERGCVAADAGNVMERQ